MPYRGLVRPPRELPLPHPDRALHELESMRLRRQGYGLDQRLAGSVHRSGLGMGSTEIRQQERAIQSGGDASKSALEKVDCLAPTAEEDGAAASVTIESDAAPVAKSIIDACDGRSSQALGMLEILSGLSLTATNRVLLGSASQHPDANRERTWLERIRSVQQIHRGRPGTCETGRDP